MFAFLIRALWRGRAEKSSIVKCLNYFICGNNVTFSDNNYGALVVLGWFFY
jgi:hypothetical protein